MATKATTVNTSITVIEVSQGEVTFRLLGETPLIQEAVGEKARRELLLPRGRMNAAAKATSLKHDPRAEFLASTYRVRSGPTQLAMPATAFKDAIRTAALDLTGVSKAEIGRLTYVVGDMVPVWGVPELLMSIVRSSDINRTPDVRTRPILRRWATEVTIRFTRPKMTEAAIARLLVAAGMTAGVGGWRQEKGSGNYGLFRIVTQEDDATWREIVASGGREAQEEALRAPVCYDEQTADLLDWYEEEVGIRKMRGAA
jgi:hypothetical protein